MAAPSHETRVRSALRKMAEERGVEAAAAFAIEMGYTLRPPDPADGDGADLYLMAERLEPDELAAFIHWLVDRAGGLNGGVQFCQMLGIPHSQRGNLYRLNGLPDELGTTERGKVWLRSEAEAFAKARRANRDTT